jgi:hypothetical protein
MEVELEGVDKFAAKLASVVKQVESLHKQVPQQLVEWQTEDMRRHYPNIQVDETNESVEATTMIWPRSRLELEPGFKRPRPTVKRGPTVPRAKGLGRRPASTRPLLRTELFQKLTDRMDALLKAIRWR